MRTNTKKRKKNTKFHNIYFENEKIVKAVRRIIIKIIIYRMRQNNIEERYGHIFFLYTYIY